MLGVQNVHFSFDLWGFGASTNFMCTMWTMVRFANRHFSGYWIEFDFCWKTIRRAELGFFWGTWNFYQVRVHLWSAKEGTCLKNFTKVWIFFMVPNRALGRFKVFFVEFKLINWKQKISGILITFRIETLLVDKNREDCRTV